jgi:membrane protein
MSLRWLVRVFVDAWDRFTKHGDMLAGSLAFFGLLSLAPLVVIAISVASVLVERERVRQALIAGARDMASSQIVDEVVKLIDAVEQQQTGVGALIAGFLLLWAASKLFMQIEEALNLIWGVETKTALTARQTVQRLVMKRLISFAMVIGCGVLLLSMLIVQAVLVMIGEVASRALGVELAVLGPPIVFFTLLTALFALMYRVLPDTEIQFREVWVGATTTSVLVLLGTWLLGLYLTRIAPAWLQGAAGALAAFMVWTYYLAQVFLLGASFTRAWAVRERGDARKAIER